MKAIEQFFLWYCLIIEPYKVISTFGPLSEILKCDQCIQIKAVRQTFPVVLSDCVVKTRRF